VASERGLSLLSDLAELYVGDPVKVGAMPSAAKALGNADYTPDGWVIGLRSDLWGNPAELALTFLHEVAHVVLGHVAAKVATGPRYDLDELEHAASALDGKASGMALKETALGYRLTGDDVAELGMALGAIRQAETVITRLLDGTGIVKALDRATFTDAELAELGLGERLAMLDEPARAAVGKVAEGLAEAD